MKVVCFSRLLHTNALQIYPLSCLSEQLFKNFHAFFSLNPHLVSAITTLHYSAVEVFSFAVHHESERAWCPSANLRRDERARVLSAEILAGDFKRDRKRKCRGNRAIILPPNLYASAESSFADPTIFSLHQFHARVDISRPRLHNPPR